MTCRLALVKRKAITEIHTRCVIEKDTVGELGRMV
jgi:hypothetical protein